MDKLTRRAVLTGAAAATAAPALPLTKVSPALASAPAAAKQAPGFYRAKLGDFEITQIADGARTFPMPDTFVKNVPKE